MEVSELMLVDVAELTEVGLLRLVAELTEVLELIDVAELTEVLEPILELLIEL